MQLLKWHCLWHCLWLCDNACSKASSTYLLPWLIILKKDTWKSLIIFQHHLGCTPPQLIQVSISVIYRRNADPQWHISAVWPLEWHHFVSGGDGKNFDTCGRKMRINKIQISTLSLSLFLPFQAWDRLEAFVPICWIVNASFILRKTYRESNTILSQLCRTYETKNRRILCWRYHMY